MGRSYFKLIFLFIITGIITPVCFAKADITFSMNQTDYYFNVGENALVALETENTYNKPVDGMLSYTITQSINQGGFSYSSSNTQSKNFVIQEGKNTVGFNFGTSDSPSTLKVAMSFNYNLNEARVVNLDEITIHFVSDGSQKKNKQNQVKSSSEKASQANQQNQNTLSQQMQNQINQMFNNQQPQQDSQQRLQNNQLAQDSSALKQQMQKQIQEQQKMRDEFQKQLSKNKQLQDMNQQLLEQGYNQTGSKLDPVTNDSGTFEINYQNENGESANIKGEMKNGEMIKLKKQTAEDREKMIKKLQENPDFKKFEKQLAKHGFNQTDVNFEQMENKTLVNVNYKNKNNENASIKSEFNNGNITKVELEDNSHNKNLWPLVIVVILLSLLGYLIYKKYKKKIIPESEEELIKEKPFDYLAEATKMLEQSKSMFENKKYKDAYGKAGQALRLFLSYENNLKKELTNDDIIRHLKKQKKSYKEIKEYFDLCSLVEFAKYHANKKDFNRIINIAEKLIK